MRIEDCPVTFTLDVIGGKWKPLILYALKESPLRFGELRRKLAGASHKVVTEQLRQLEADRVIERSVVPGAQLHTEYRLSDYGETLRPLLSLLADWGLVHRKKDK